VPPAGAGRLKVTVQVEEPPLPPVIVVGLHASALTVCASAPGTIVADAASTRAAAKSFLAVRVIGGLLSYCTLAVTVAAAVSVKVHVLVLFPPLEHAPDQIASRPFDTLSVIEVPVLNDADPELPTATLIPAGLDVTRSPLRPVAVTVKVAGCPGGGAAPCGVKLRTDDHAPAVPAELMPRTRHQCCRAASDVTVS